MKLYIGNKNYSSWSFRPWMALSVHEIPFEEVLRPFDVENDFADFFEFSPTGKVPVLEDGAIKVWESLAIMEYVAERSPEKGLWPKDPARRAWARSVAHEMHAGFLALRGACPMNMRRRVEALAVDDAVRKDVRRIEAIWTETLKASGGPYLFGETYTIADAMYAPVVNRFEIYQLSKAP
ncbi:MAG: glutathione S-transferase family protein, partial [Myxococcota bacterium]